MFGCLRIVTIVSTSHGWPRWATIITSSGKASAISSSCTGFAHFSGALRGNVVPWCQIVGSPSSTHFAQSGKYAWSVGSKCW